MLELNSRSGRSCQMTKTVAPTTAANPRTFVIASPAVGRAVSPMACTAAIYPQRALG